MGEFEPKKTLKPPNTLDSAPKGAGNQVLGKVTPTCPWYLPPRSL